VLQEPAVKKILYWCRTCNVPLIGRTCGCGATGEAVFLQKPYDLRPALSADQELITRLLQERFGNIPIPSVILLNKTGGLDRYELIIAHGARFGWLEFNPVTRNHILSLFPEALPFIVPFAERGIVDIPVRAGEDEDGKSRRIGGKKVEVSTNEPDGSIIVRYGGRYGTGILTRGTVRVKELIRIEPLNPPESDWGEVIRRNYDSLKDLERSAVRSIKQEMKRFTHVNVSFSGGKDSTAALALARKAGIKEAYFVDTHLEFPETYAFIKEQEIPVLSLDGGDFWQAVEKIGPPGKDNRWCCKGVKMAPVRRWMDTLGPVLTVQGNRWYESFNRADLDLLSNNPHNPNQTNCSPIRSWRAFEVFLYLKWRAIAYNPLYDMGIERIGCWLCPAMLEAEYDILRKQHPELAGRWDAFLEKWAAEKGYPSEYIRYGMWRWKSLPPKMRKLAKEMGIPVPKQPDIVHGERRDQRERPERSGRTGQAGRSSNGSSSGNAPLRTWSTGHPSSSAGSGRCPLSRSKKKV
jgi:cysteine desulfurase/selenocysteine lyase